MLSAPMNSKYEGSVLCELNDGTQRWVDAHAAKIMEQMHMLKIVEIEKREAAND